MLASKQKKRTRLYIVEKIAKKNQYLLKDYVNKTLLNSLQKKINLATMNEEDRKSILESLDIVCENEISFYIKKEWFNSIIVEFFNELCNITINEKIDVEVRGFGVFELKKHKRFGTTALKFAPSVDLRKSIKQNNDVDVESIEELLKQKELMDSVMENRGIKVKK